MAEPPRFSMREFKRLAIRAIAAVSAAVRRIRVDDEVFRRLRRKMVATVATREHLLEALTLLMRQIAERTTSRNVRFADVADLIRGPIGLPVNAAEVNPAADHDAAGEEAEFVLDVNLAAAPTWNMRAILDRFRDADGRTVYLVAWEPTAEPAAIIPRHLIAAFDRQRHALVHRTYIEDEAEEA